jgi:restriction system protein
MISCSPPLAAWLSEILAVENEANHCDDGAGNEGGTRAIWCFPGPEVRDEYLATIETRPEDEVRRVIERMLIPSVALGSDYHMFQIWLDLLEKGERRSKDDSEYLARLNKSEHMNRTIRWFLGASEETPWQGLKWVLDLLPFRPRQALNVIQAYVTAHAPSMSDVMYDALHDTQALIRARYIGVPESTAERVRLLQELSFREFEQIVEQLYAQLGYETRLTPPSNDGGRDVIATSSTAGSKEHLLVECKRYQGKVGIQAVKVLLATVSTELANKGALVTTAEFTRTARKLEAADHRIELISGPQLVLLLNEYLGHAWPAHIEWLARERPIAVKLRNRE